MTHINQVLWCYLDALNPVKNKDRPCLMNIFVESEYIKGGLALIESKYYEEVD
jgi:hypothetical protein